MKVCVIIPVFNEQDFIKKSVESLIDQTIKPAEVISVSYTHLTLPTIQPV